MLPQDNNSTIVGILKSCEFNIKENISNHGILKDIKFVSLGYAKNVNSYPHLLIIPVNERIKRYYSSGICDVIRTIRFSITTSKTDLNSAFGQSTGLINSLKNLFSKRGDNSFWKLKSLITGKVIVLDTLIQDIKNPEPMSYNGLTYSKSFVDIDFLTRIRNDELLQNYSKGLVETNSKELSKIINNILKNYKDSLLNEVRSFKYGVTSPYKNINYPLLSTTIGNASIEPEFVGLNTYNSNITIFIFNSVFGNKFSLFQNLDLAHKVRQILFANKYVLNRCFDYQLGNITYGVIEDIENNGSLTYATQVDINTKSYEQIY